MVDLSRERLLKVSDVSKRFRVHRRTVESWFARGLASVMVGRLVFTSEEALARFARQREPESRQPQTATAEDERQINDAVREFGLSL